MWARNNVCTGNNTENISFTSKNKIVRYRVLRERFFYTIDLHFLYFSYRWGTIIFLKYYPLHAHEPSILTAFSIVCCRVANTSKPLSSLQPCPPQQEPNARQQPIRRDRRVGTPCHGLRNIVLVPSMMSLVTKTLSFGFVQLQKMGICQI